MNNRCEEKSLSGLLLFFLGLSDESSLFFGERRRNRLA
jgi:hypothetical protein